MPDSCITPHLVEMQDSLFPINHYKNRLFSQNITVLTPAVTSSTQNLLKKLRNSYLMY